MGFRLLASKVPRVQVMYGCTRFVPLVLDKAHPRLHASNQSKMLPRRRVHSPLGIIAIEIDRKRRPMPYLSFNARFATRKSSHTLPITPLGSSQSLPPGLTSHILQPPSPQRHPTNPLHHLRRPLLILLLHKPHRHPQLPHLITPIRRGSHDLPRGMEPRHPAPEMPAHGDRVEDISVLEHLQDPAHFGEGGVDAVVVVCCGGRGVVALVVAGGGEEGKVVPEEVLVVLLVVHILGGRRGDAGWVQEVAGEEVLEDVEAGEEVGNGGAEARERGEVPDEAGFEGADLVGEEGVVG